MYKTVTITTTNSQQIRYTNQRSNKLIYSFRFLNNREDLTTIIESEKLNSVIKNNKNSNYY